MQLLCGGTLNLTHGFQAPFLILFLLFNAVSHSILFYFTSVELWFDYEDTILKAFKIFWLSHNITSHPTQIELHFRSGK